MAKLRSHPATAATVDYIDQSASRLALNLLQGAVDMRQFTVLRAASLDVGEVTIRAAVIGASHVLSFETPQLTVTEVFACTGERFGAKQLFFGPLPHLLDRETRVDLPDGLAYRFHTFFGEPVHVERLKASLANNQRAIGMAFTFPQRAPGEAPPETVVSVRHTGTSVLAETAHGYRKEGRVVMTSSELTWRRHT